MKLIIIVVAWLSCYGNELSCYKIVMILVLGPYSILDSIRLHLSVSIYCVCVCLC